jgi:hypothetical protein
LRLKLTELAGCKLVSFWAIVEHLPEDDEGGKKKHLHVYIEPSKLIQTDDLKEQFKEFDPTNPAKPLGCISFHTSKFADWYLYALHDKAYLASKGESRTYHYHPEDVLTSDEDELLFKVRTINLLAVSPYQAMIDAQAQGVTWEEFFRRGTVPLPQVSLWEKAWFLLVGDRTDRGGRANHPSEMPSEPSETPSELESVLDTIDCIADQKETWCGATRDEWAELYESATNDSEGLDWYDVHPQDGYRELDPDEGLPL